jgi:hypothetical protein
MNITGFHERVQLECAHLSQSRLSRRVIRGVHSPMLFRHSREYLLQVAEPVFGSLCGRSLDDGAAHQGFLLRDTVLELLEIAIELVRMGSL